MHKSRVILFIGVLVALLPVLGFPRAWESFFQIFAGLGIVVLSVWSTIDRKLSHKAKAQMRQARKLTTPLEEATNEEAQSFGKRVTDFYPKTGQLGRRMSDLNPNDPEENLN